MDNTRTLKSAFDQTARWYPNKEAFVQAESGYDSRTFSEANETARRFANSLVDVGVEKGDRVVFLTDTTVRQAIAFFGIMKTGAISASLHMREASGTISSLLDRLEPTVLVYQSKFTDDLDAIEDIDVEQYVCLDSGHETPDYGISFESLIETSDSSEPNREIDSTDDAFITFSSGTTGEPKGIVHTHGEAIESAHLGQYIYRTDADDVLLNPYLPTFTGWTDMLFPYVFSGATTVFLQEWDSSKVLETIESEGVTGVVLIPTQWKILLREESVAQFDTGSLRLAGYSGESLSTDVLEELQSQFTDNFVSVYGTTETMNSSIVKRITRAEDDRSVESTGHPVPTAEAKIIEPDSRDPSLEVDDGETGELIIRGPSVASEIWRDSERTDDIFHEDGWYFTGDLATIGPDLNVYIEGRVDNMIISGGINIYPEGVEKILEGHPDVEECAIIGIPHDDWGETLKAFVLPSTETLSQTALDQWCKDHEDLGNYQRPRAYEYVDEFPLTSTGKVDRNALSERR